MSPGPGVVFGHSQTDSLSSMRDHMDVTVVLGLLLLPCVLPEGQTNKTNGLFSLSH